MDRLSILLRLISQHREQFETSQSTEDLDNLIGFGQEALALFSEEDPRRTSLVEQVEFDLELRSAIALSLDGDDGTSRVLEKQSVACPSPPSRSDDHDTLFDGLPEELAADLELRYAMALSNDDHEGMARVIQEYVDLEGVIYQRRRTRAGENPDLRLITGLMQNDEEEMSRLGQSGIDMQLQRMTANFSSADVEAMIPMIPIITQQLQRRPPGHPERAFFLSVLASSLVIRCSRSWSASDNEKSIQLLNEALELYSNRHPFRSECLSHLAIALNQRYRRTGSREDLEEGIRINAEDLELHPCGHPNRGSCLNNLANGLFDRYSQFGSRHDLEKAIELHTEALEIHTPNHRLRSDSLNNLANALVLRYEQSGLEDDLRRSIKLHLEALELRPPGHPNRSSSLSNLANALLELYQRSGSEDELQRAVELYKESLALRPPGHVSRSDSLDNLACAYKSRYERFGSEDDLERMIELHTEALQLRPPGDLNRSKSLHNLAFALNSRYDRFQSDAELERMINLYTQALELCPHGHQLRSGTLNNLAIALQTRYGLYESENDLKDLIKLHTHALELRPPGNAYRGASLDNLALALRIRYNRYGSEDDLNRSIELHSQALELRPPGHPHRGRSFNNLAIAFMTRFERSNSSVDLNESIRLHRESRALYGPGHLAHARITADLADALWHSRITPSNTDEIFGLLREVSEDIISPLQEVLVCVRLWVQWARSIDHESLADAYDHAIQFLRRYLAIGPTIKHQYAALLRDAGMLSLPMDAAAHAIKNGNPERAIELLDTGRSLLWSEMRRFREPQLEIVDESLAARFASTCSQLQTMSTAESTYDTMLEEGTKAGQIASGAIPYSHLLSGKRKLLQEYEELLDVIRQEPGMELFLRNLPFSKLQEAAVEGPVIVINCSRYGSHAIIVFSNRRPSVVPLDEDFYDIALSTCKLFLEARCLANGSQSSSKAFGDRLKPITGQLWTIVVSKVFKELEDARVPKRSRIWWCPTSFLTILPFHAAGVGNCFLIDTYVSSYTSTLKALADARQLPSPHVTKKSERRETPHPRLLVVKPDSNLFSAGLELDVMCKLGSFVKCLNGPNATQSSVLTHLPSHDWIHFICHGELSGTPFDSSLHLNDGDTLSLNNIIKTHLPDAKFAFLGACHTAEQSASGLLLGDETLHLAGAMQFSGFPSVVGTMWEMEDADGPDVAKRFYEEMLKGEADAKQRHTRAARALWKVTRKMRKEGIPMERWVNYIHIGA